MTIIPSGSGIAVGTEEAVCPDRALRTVSGGRSLRIGLRERVRTSGGAGLSLHGGSRRRKMGSMGAAGVARGGANGKSRIKKLDIDALKKEAGL